MSTFDTTSNSTSYPPIKALLPPLRKEMPKLSPFKMEFPKPPTKPPAAPPAAIKTKTSSIQSLI
jgi:hypothetical protein